MITFIEDEHIIISMPIESFYEQLDVIFDDLYNEYGLIDELIQYKHVLISAYEKEHSYRNAYNTQKEKNWYIDENGYVKSK
jgi:hypothetical protein